MDVATVLISLATGFVVALLCTPLVARFAIAVDVVDRPSDRTVSRRANMPLLGGLAVALGFASALVVALWLSDATVAWSHVLGLGLGGAVILVAGIVDDRTGLDARGKLLFQATAAAICIASGYTIDHVTDPFTRAIYDLPRWLGWLVAAFWIVGITNAVNLLDGLDGLASGVAAITGATLTYVAWKAGQPLAVFIGVALVGSVMGFLPFNFPPARIFLGDTGSLLLGFVLAVLALEGQRRGALLPVVVPLLALAVPILDTALSIVRRLRMRAPLFSADRLHMHHRLLAAEGTQRAAALQFYLLTGAFCLLAVSFTRLQGTAAVIFLIAVAALTLRLLVNLGVLSIEGVEMPPADLPGGAKEEER